MSVDPAKLTRTRIVWVRVTDMQHRNPKTRPAVVLYPPASDSPDAEFQVACSSRTPPVPENAAEAFYQQGKDQPGGHPRTGLREGGWVYANWIRTVRVGEVEGLAKFMNAAQFVELVKLVEQAGSLTPPSDATGPT